MNVLVLGAHGNMGRRYSAIVEHLGHRALPYDLGHDKFYLFDQFRLADKVIVATPTNTHLDIIEKLPSKSVPLLCEKPPVTSFHDFAGLKKKCLDAGFEFWCVNQYCYLPEARTASEGETFYDYYNHGKDGIHWDCFQLYTLARGPVRLREKSPVWKCTINGTPVHAGNMDQAYVDMLKGFIDGSGVRWGFDICEETISRILKEAK